MYKQSNRGNMVPQANREYHSAVSRFFINRVEKVLNAYLRVGLYKSFGFGRHESGSGGPETLSPPPPKKTRVAKQFAKRPRPNLKQILSEQLHFGFSRPELLTLVTPIHIFYCLNRTALKITIK